MKDLHATLPFTELRFFVFLLIGVMLLFISRKLLRSVISYKWLLALVSSSYLMIFFTKPVQILGLMIYCYGIYFLFSKVFKYKKLLLPVILLAVPMLFMKTLNILPNGEPGILHNLAIVFQISGISFLTFKVIQLYIDESQKEQVVSPLDFFNFVAFVPTLLIGPIDRFGRFNANVEDGYQSMNGNLLIEGINDVIKGLLYKFIIAHAIAVLFRNELFNDGSWSFHFQNMYSYLFYLFFDFAGYSLLAIGFGKMMGIAVPINFDRPFLAINPKDFWKRWHITLGDWLNDYFFKPVFKELTTKKKFKPIQRQNLVLFLTFTLMGFWNGFELHFILSGLLFGLYSVVHNYYVYLCKKGGKDVLFGTLNPTIVRLLSIFLMFNAVAFSIYIFSGELNYLLNKL